MLISLRKWVSLLGAICATIGTVSLYYSNNLGMAEGYGVAALFAWSNYITVCELEVMTK